MPFLKVDEENNQDIHLHFEDHGQGSPILLIHGYPFSGKAWEKMEPILLSCGHRVITYDRRGFGQSSKPSVGYDYDTFAKDLHLLIQELDLQDVTLVGHSMGTGEIVRYLSSFGDQRIRNAVFISPIPPFLLKTEDNPEGLDKKIFHEFKEQIKEDRHVFLSDFLNNFYSRGLMTSTVSDEKLRADFAIGAASSPIAFYECVETWLTDFRGDLLSINVPSLIIHGDNDKILPIEATAQRLTPAIHAELKVIEGGSHGIPWTNAKQICEFIEDFLGTSPESFAAEKIPVTPSPQMIIDTPMIPGSALH